jgi:hypothetical protein
VGLIEDEDLVAVTSRSEDGAFTEVPCIVDTVVAGGVNFDNVE